MEKFFQEYEEGMYLQSSSIHQSIKQSVNQSIDFFLGLIGVHCTHGLNRTGYLVCRLVLSIDEYSNLLWYYGNVMTFEKSYLFKTII